MSLEQTNKIDSIGLHRESGDAVLTIADSWAWSDTHGHLLSLQDKVNSYFDFIESGQVWESYPASKGRQLRINVVFRFAPPEVALEFLARVADVASELSVLISHETCLDADCEG